MSSSYASRLSEYKDKGVCGLPETFDSQRALQVKIKRLQELMQQAKRVVVLTGAGISTSAGIPDFRGPWGVWTKEKEVEQQQQAAAAGTTDSTTDTASKKRKRKRFPPLTYRVEPKELENFADAKPTICHRAITKLALMDKIDYCITQNVDGLHRRSGLPRDKHCSVHGCVFTEKCHRCHAEFFRDYDVGGMSFQPTGRKCPLCVHPQQQPNGNNNNHHHHHAADLCDTLLDWEDPLPETDFERANQECQAPGTLVLCLGTSLRIHPVGSLPELAEKYVIVNLQKTPLDERAALLIRAPVDTVMDQLIVLMGYPRWKEEDPLPPIERVWIPKTSNSSTNQQQQDKTTATNSKAASSVLEGAEETTPSKRPKMEACINNRQQQQPSSSTVGRHTLTDATTLTAVVKNDDAISSPPITTMESSSQNNQQTQESKSSKDQIHGSNASVVEDPTLTTGSERPKMEPECTVNHPQHPRHNRHKDDHGKSTTTTTTTSAHQVTANSSNREIVRDNDKTKTIIVIS